MAPNALPTTIGEQYGCWEVISDQFKLEGRKNRYVQCRCECGHEQPVMVSMLKSGGSTKCKKCRGKYFRVVKVGDQFKDWTVIGEVRRPDNRLLWKCRCTCGNEAELATCQLRSDKHVCCQECSYIRQRTGVEGTIWHNIRTGAEKRNIPLEITWEDAKDVLVTQDFKCALSGLPIKLAEHTQDYDNGGNTASLDRTDNDQGYTKPKIQWLHKWVNIAKKDHPQDEFLWFCRHIAKTHPDPEDPIDRLTRLSQTTADCRA